MPLTHVCIWDSNNGYIRISAEAACKKYPYGIAASSGIFVCELCAQNVLLTAPGQNTRHFRHDPSSPNKECDERQKSFDPTYGRSLRDLSSHQMPLKLVVANGSFTLQLGFFNPPDQSAVCDKIIISRNNQQPCIYSFERIGQAGTTYLDIGNTPCSYYSIEYTNATSPLKKYWSNKVTGVTSTGTFFDASSGIILQPGGKAYAGNSYYLLQPNPLYSASSDIKYTEVARVRRNVYSSWYVYKIVITRFSEASAKFFLKHSIFLTEKPTKLIPVWPTCVQRPYMVFHNSDDFYFFMNGDDSELRVYPTNVYPSPTETGNLFRLRSQGKEQLVSIGKSGALGFSYLIKKNLNLVTDFPQILITDANNRTLPDDEYNTIPKSKCITISSKFDGKAVVLRRGHIVYIHKISSEQNTLIDNLTFDMEVQFFQGQDLVRSICFKKASNNDATNITDDNLVAQLEACRGPSRSITHTAGALAIKLDLYPKTKQWLLRAIRRGKISCSAFYLLVHLNETQAEG